GFGYVGSGLHRIIPWFMLQGQDLTRHTQRKLTSEAIILILFGYLFPDQNFIHRHDRTGLLSKANAGR
ncbi:hypothetical protein B0H14DRAFT_2207536, partial [Mycena olivaceomarginata]